MKKNDFRDFLNQYSEASVKVLDEEIGKDVYKRQHI